MKDEADYGTVEAPETSKDDDKIVEELTTVVKTEVPDMAVVEEPEKTEELEEQKPSHAERVINRMTAPQSKDTEIALLKAENTSLREQIAKLKKALSDMM